VHHKLAVVCQRLVIKKRLGAFLLANGGFFVSEIELVDKTQFVHECPRLICPLDMTFLHGVTSKIYTCLGCEFLEAVRKNTCSAQNISLGMVYLDIVSVLSAEHILGREEVELLSVMRCRRVPLRKRLAQRLKVHALLVKGLTRCSRILLNLGL